MKNLKSYKKLFVIVICIVFAQMGKAQLDVDCYDNIGIGGDANSSYKLRINGNTLIEGSGAHSDIVIIPGGGYYGPSIEPTGINVCDLGDASHSFRNLWVQYINGSLYDPSDSRFKENIKPINNALDLITKLNGVKYDVRKEFTYDAELIKNELEIEKNETARKNHYGFIAQELLDIIPEVVKQDDSTGYYSVNYVRFIPILVSAMQEQQKVIDNLTGEIESLKSSQSSTKAAERSFPDEIEETSISQNQPNPFNDETVIKYYLEKSTTKATLYVYDMNGSQLKNIPLLEKGHGSVTIQGGELKAGMYLYSLVSDGKIVGTYQMILTD